MQQGHPIHKNINKQEKFLMRWLLKVEVLFLLWGSISNPFKRFCFISETQKSDPDEVVEGVLMRFLLVLLRQHFFWWLRHLLFLCNATLTCFKCCSTLWICALAALPKPPEWKNEPLRSYISRTKKMFFYTPTIDWPVNCCLVWAEDQCDGVTVSAD